MKYHAEIGDFVTSSLHFFEREEYRSIGAVLGTNTSSQPNLSIDPEGRILACKVFSSNLALIPLVKANGDEFESTQDGALDNLRSSVIHFAKDVDPRLKNVRKFTFLPGFLNPTLAILYDRGSNCEHDVMIARAANNQSYTNHPKETCALMIVAIEPVKFSSKVRSATSSDFQFTVINCIESIPLDCSELFPLPKPVGGLFLVTNNMLMWCDVSGSTAPYCIATNPFASLTFAGRIAITQFSSLAIPTLHSCHFLSLGVEGDALKNLLVTATGDKFIVTISRSGRTLGFFNIEHVSTDSSPASPCPSSLVSFGSNLIFLASEGGNCQLLEMTTQEQKQVSTVEQTKTQPAVTPSPVLSNHNMDDIDAYLYGEEAKSVSSSRSSIKAPTGDDDYLASLEKEAEKLQPASAALTGVVAFKLVDELECLGPIMDLAVGCSDKDSLEMVALGGSHSVNGTFHPGSINVVTQQLPAVFSTTFALPDTKQLWTVNLDNGETRFLVSSTSGSTLVLSTSQDKIVELEESSFYLEGPTLYCGAVHLEDGTCCILQVYSGAMRLLSLDGTRILGQIEHNMTSIRNVAGYRGGIFCLLTDGSLLDFVLTANGIAERPTNMTGIAAFTVFRQELLLMVANTGSLGIFTVHDRRLLFENSAFNRLPSALMNRVGVQMPTVDLNQRIISLDTLDSQSDKAECFVVARFDSASDRHSRLQGSLVYRLNLRTFVFTRVAFNVLGKVSAGSQIPGSVALRTNELVLYSPLQEQSSSMLVGLNRRNFPRHHCLLPSDRVLAMAAYNDSSLLVLKTDGSVSILDTLKSKKDVNLDWESELVLKRLSLPNASSLATFVAFHPPSRTYLVASAALSSDFKLPDDEYAPISDNTSFPTVNGAESLPKLQAAQSCSLHLLNPLGWKFVDESAADLFIPYETVTCMRTLELATQQSLTGFHPFLTVGTAYQKSEDRPIRGRGLVFDVAEVIPEPGKPETNRKLRMKGITDFKGPVFALTPLLDGNIAISLGPKVVVHAFEDEKFAAVAFHDIGTCSLALASLKNFIVTADLTKSVAFLAFQAEPLARVHALGRDYGQNLQCAAVEFLVNSDGQVMIVAADDQGGLHFYCYAPKNLTTNSGQRLLDKGSFFLHGAPVNKLVRLPAPGRPRDSVIISAGQDGSVHLISPLPVASFRRLYVLEMRLAAMVPDFVGIATRVARQVPRRMTVTHALPVTGQTTVTLPTSLVTSAIESVKQSSSTPNNPESSTIILHHLPVSNAIVDGLALRRFFNHALFDGLARQTLSNRFGLDYNSLMEELVRIYQFKNIF